MCITLKFNTDTLMLVVSEDISHKHKLNIESKSANKSNKNNIN